MLRAIMVSLATACVSGLRVQPPQPTRRSVVMGLAANAVLPIAANAALPFGGDAEPKVVLRGPDPRGIYALQTEDLEALDLWSKTAAGKTLPNGVKVIDVALGTGSEPKAGQRIFCHFKVWTKGFRSGVPADSSFRQARVYEWNLGTPTDRMPVGADEAIVGMKEGGWRRMVIPAALAYGSEGLQLPNSKVLAVPPDTTVFFDVRMLPAAMCEEILHPPGVSDLASQRLKSISCKRGVP